jgi:hypothetical protein
MKASEVLAQAMGLVLANPTQGAFARDARGFIVNSHSEQACSFCTYGALHRVCGPESLDRKADRAITLAAARVLQEAGIQASSIHPAVFINDHKPELVKMMFTRAIELAKKEEANEAQ